MKLSMANHLVAFGDQPVTQMGADETGGAGHYESQGMLSNLSIVAKRASLYGETYGERKPCATLAGR